MIVKILLCVFIINLTVEARYLLVKLNADREQVDGYTNIWRTSSGKYCNMLFNVI